MIKKILIIFGTRPEAIKMAPLVKIFKENPKRFDVKVCVTAQHREMLDQVLELFNIIPDYDLNIMREGQDLYDITSRVLLGVRDIIHDDKPDLIFVHGDTSTSTSAALAAFYQKIPIAHVEAGLRTYNLYSPWPEEMNRQITDRLATYHFAPTSLNKKNLLEERIMEKNIFITGNTVIDALYWVINKLNNDLKLEKRTIDELADYGLPEIRIMTWKKQVQNNSTSGIEEKRKMILITGHRRENFGKGFINICEAIKVLSKKFPEIDFVYPMHLNPHVRNAINDVFNKDSHNGKNGNPNIYFIEPLDYLPFIYLMNLSYLILTDSGGIQEEAPSLGKPVLVMRDTTERPEALEAETVKLVGTDRINIINEVSLLINDKYKYDCMRKKSNPYGNGSASERIHQIIRDIKKQ